MEDLRRKGYTNSHIHTQKKRREEGKTLCCMRKPLFLAGSDFFTWLLSVKDDLPQAAVKDQNRAAIFQDFFELHSDPLFFQPVAKIGGCLLFIY